MKRIIASVVLLLIVASLCFTEYYFSQKTYDEIKAFSEKYKNNVEELDYDEFLKLNESWEKEEKILSLFFNHTIIEDVCVEFATLEHYITIKDNNYTKLFINRLESKAEAIVDEEYFSFSNIF